MFLSVEWKHATKTIVNIFHFSHQLCILASYWPSILVFVIKILLNTNTMNKISTYITDFQLFLIVLTNAI